MHLNISEMKELCKELLDDCERVLSWKWDSGFNSLVAEFATDKQDEVRALLERHLGFAWDSRSIRKAPEKVRAKTGDLGDLRDNQLLFTSDPNGNTLIFAAWWPWGNGEVVSVRLASLASIADERALEPKGVLARIKHFFG
jgi:hypothetical protein